MTDAPPLEVVIVEDELPQRRQLCTWLTRVPGIHIVGEAGDGASAVRLIDSTVPDLVFLDISLPELSGLDVLKQITYDPEIVFTTAFRDFAIDAFELGAIDYLLKPFGPERVEEAIARVRGRKHERASPSDSITERMRSVTATGEPLDRLFVRERNGIIPITVDDIVRLEADGDYTAVITPTRRHLVAVPLKVLLDRIARRDFLRIHRQHVVNMRHVARIEPHDATRLEVHFAAGGTVVASRAGSQMLRGLLA